ncbi:MAG: lipid-A-disaccharide synthase [Candidatus Solibacter usitatus]|nr:lipid-A-disaccharide synthase [Candidatus Solibacter usitatus]
MPLKILVSAGEASGDRYAAGVVSAIRRRAPETTFFGCTGNEMRAAGVRTEVDAASLSVVGLVEVLHHIPRIYGEYRRLIAAAKREKPDLAILTDSPDFHLPLARRLTRLGIPVYYLVAPQAWAWREGRVTQLKRNVKELHCIFPFEETFFRTRGVNAHYIGHPLAGVVRTSLDRTEFFRKHSLPEDRPLIALCPGSRKGEIARHIPALREALALISARRACTFLLAAPAGARERFGAGLYAPLLNGGARYCEGETWDAMGHSGLTLAASGTVTVEAALLGAPMVAFYRVMALSWAIGRFLVRAPFYSMVNLAAGRKVVPELIQDGMTGPAIAREALRLLESPLETAAMKTGLAEVRQSLSTATNPFDESAARILAS